MGVAFKCHGMKCLNLDILVDFTPGLKTLFRQKKLVISEPLGVRMWKASNSNNVIS